MYLRGTSATSKLAMASVLLHQHHVQACPSRLHDMHLES